MNFIKQAIRVLTDPNDPNDLQIKNLELQTLKGYYETNIAAHREYMEKGIYNLIPSINEFKEEMEQIEKILDEQRQLRLF